MATQILTRHSTKRMVLANSSVARQMSIGSSWTRIRIVLHMAMNGATAAGTPRLALGVCSGTSSLYPGNCHFAGYYTNAATLTAATTSHSGITTGATNRLRMLKKEGSVETLGTDSNNASASNFLGGSTSSNNNAAYFLEVEKTSGTTWTFRIGGGTTVTSGTVTEDLILQLAEQTWNGISLTSHTYIRPQETQIIDEGANGIMDSVCVYWDRTDPVVDLLGVYVAKLL